MCFLAANLQTDGERCSSEKMCQDIFKILKHVNAIENLTRTSSINYHVGNVSKPLASAVRVVKAGNNIVLGPSTEDSFI